MIFQILSASTATMAIIDTKYLNVRPVIDDWFLLWRMDNIQYNSYPVFILLSYQAYISVCWKCLYSTKSLRRYFAALEIRQALVVNLLSCWWMQRAITPRLSNLIAKVHFILVWHITIHQRVLAVALSPLNVLLQYVVVILEYQSSGC